MFRYRYRVYLPVAVSCLFGYHRQPKASNVNVKCYNTFNLISRQLMPITFVYSGLFVVREICQWHGSSREYRCTHLWVLQTGSGGGFGSVKTSIVKAFRLLCANFMLRTSKFSCCITEQSISLEGVNVLASGTWTGANAHDPHIEFLFGMNADVKYTYAQARTHTHSMPGVFLSRTHTAVTPEPLQARRDSDKEFFLPSARQSNMAAGSGSTSLLPSHGLKLPAEQSESLCWGRSLNRVIVPTRLFRPD